MSSHHVQAHAPIVSATPRHVVKVWGGHRLLGDLEKSMSSLQQDPPNKSDPVGEAWEVADLIEGSSFVRSGQGGDVTLRAFIERAPGLFPFEGGRYPLLIKTLDAARDLSIQVHPGERHLDLFDDSSVRQKDECWLILAAEPGGSILHGFNEGVTKAEFERAVETRDDLSSLLRRHEVTPGELIHVPPGTVHAICAGVTLLEVQQPSDTTFRVWDYDRPGLDGSLRPLHLDDAMKVLDFGEQPQVVHTTLGASDDDGVLIDTGHYRITRVTVRGGEADVSSTLQCDTRVTALYALDHRVELDAGDVTQTLERGEFALCTAQCEVVRVRATPHDAATVLVIEGPVIAKQPKT